MKEAVHPPEKLSRLNSLFERLTRQSNAPLQLQIEEQDWRVRAWNTIYLPASILDSDESDIDLLLQREIRRRTAFPAEFERLVTWWYIAWSQNVVAFVDFVQFLSEILVDHELSKQDGRCSDFIRKRISKWENTEHPLTSDVIREAYGLVLQPQLQVSSLKVRKFYRSLTIATSGIDGFIRNSACMLADEFTHPLQPPLCNKGPYEVSVHNLDRIVRSLLAEGASPTEIRVFLSEISLHLRTSLEPDGPLRQFDMYLKANYESIVEKSKALEPDALVDEILEHYHAKEQVSTYAQPSSSELAQRRAFLEQFMSPIASRKFGLTPRELSRVFGDATKMRLQSVFAQCFKRILGGRPDSGYPIEAWRIGDDLRMLSICDTYRAFGVFIPHVFAVKRRQPTVGKRPTNIALVMDRSGSLAFSEKLTLEQEVAYSLVEAARRGADSVTLIPFSDRVEPSEVMHASKDYDELEDAIVRLEPFGPSNLTAGLEVALKSAAEVDSQDTFIITDGDLWDVRFINRPLESLTLHGVVRIFLLGYVNKTTTELLHHMLASVSRMEIYECNVRNQKVVQAIEEFVNRQQILS